MGKVVLNKHRCKSCYYCIDACPVGAISMSELSNKKGYNVVQVDQDKCISCGSCYIVCPDYVFEIAKKGGK